MKKIFFIALFLPQVLIAQIQIMHQSAESDGCFAIVNQKFSASIYFDTADYEAVQRSAQLFASDIEMISDKKPLMLSDSKKLKGNIIIVGTIGKNQLIDRLIAEKRLIVDSIQNQWERFVIQTIDKPFKGVKKALVIVGSDRRGTSYGVFTLSEKLGVSPWYWWADMPVKKSKELYVKNTSYTSKAPSVKYRGIFLNDEDWGLHPWAAKNIDPEVGDIGPKTYEKIFELLLRLKANMVAPAMHECTKAFYTVPGNMEMADAYGIMVTTSHCEPLLYNNASEWNKKNQGEWNYATNKEQIIEALDSRVKQVHENENIYTIALRGMHDEGMKGGSDEEKLKMLDEAIKDQRSILSKYIDKPLSEIQQIFVPYKEVLGLYEKGLEVPEEITIVWPDDNYGYIKKLSNYEEQARKGGSGVYYHLSYLGWPNDYLWLNTTPPALMYAELQKAYSLGADKYWLLNVGDIKPGEMGIQLFLDMAWDFSLFSFENINQYQVEKLSSFFGDDYEEQLDFILNRYYFHGFTRKPEYMTWDWRWNSLFQIENVKDTEFSFINYNEAENRLAEYNKISEMAKAIMNKIPEEKKAAFFELVYYPIKSASLYNHEMLTGQKNRWYASQGRALTNKLDNDVKLYHDSLATLTAEYNNLLNGKWKGMMTAPGFLPEIQMSPTKAIVPSDTSGMAIFVEGQSFDSTINLALPQFNSLFNETYFFEVYNTGSTPFSFKVKTTNPWILLDKYEGSVKEQQRVNVSINWDLIKNDTELNGEIIISDGNTTKTIQVSAFRPNKSLKNVFIESNGVISIQPTGFQHKTEMGNIKFQSIKGLGYSNESLQLGSAKYDSGEGSYVEYDFFVTDTGDITIYTYMLPLFAKDKSHSTQYGVQVDNMDMVLHHNDVKEYSKEWAANVLRNSAINKTTVFLEKPGNHTLKVYCIDPGMIVQKILIDTGGMKESYLGQKSTRIE